MLMDYAELRFAGFAIARVVEQDPYPNANVVGGHPLDRD